MPGKIDLRDMCAINIEISYMISIGSILAIHYLIVQICRYTSSTRTNYTNLELWLLKTIMTLLDVESSMDSIDSNPLIILE